MKTVKQIMHEIADQLPEQATFDDAMHRLHWTSPEKVEGLLIQ